MNPEKVKDDQVEVVLVSVEERPEVAQQAQDKLVELIRFHARIRAQLPSLMAALLEQGKTGIVIAAIKAWGKGERPVDEIWAELRSHFKESAARPEAS